jgi:general secretion pathway protein N
MGTDVIDGAELSDGPPASPVADRAVSPLGSVMMRGWTALHLAGFAMLLLACLGLSAVIYDELTDDPPPPVGRVADASPAPAAVAVPPDEAPFTLPALESLKEVTDRPLFSAARRPAAARTAQQTASDLSSLQLRGVIISDQSRLALVQQAKSAAIMRVKEGQELQGWTVQSILPDRVVVQRGASVQELKLRIDMPPNRPAAAKPP